jgi:hypothetical protein
VKIKTINISPIEWPRTWPTKEEKKAKQNPKQTDIVGFECRSDIAEHLEIMGKDEYK